MGTRAATTRRSFLAVAGLAVDAYAGHRPRETPRPGARPDDRASAVRLLAAPATVDLGGRTVETWTFNGELPGPEVRLRVGKVLRIAR